VNSYVVKRIDSDFFEDESVAEAISEAGQVAQRRPQGGYVE
jgi:hypothetical protein